MHITTTTTARRDTSPPEHTPSGQHQARRRLHTLHARTLSRLSQHALAVGHGALQRRGRAYCTDTGRLS